VKKVKWLIPDRTAISSRSALMSWSTIVAPRVRRVLMASRAMTGPKEIPPAPIRQMRGPWPVLVGSVAITPPSRRSVRWYWQAR
jgi:hypothetical protein